MALRPFKRTVGAWSVAWQPYWYKQLCNHPHHNFYLFCWSAALSSPPCCTHRPTSSNRHKNHQLVLRHHKVSLKTGNETAVSPILTWFQVTTIARYSLKTQFFHFEINHFFKNDYSIVELIDKHLCTCKYLIVSVNRSLKSIWFFDKWKNKAHTFTLNSSHVSVHHVQYMRPHAHTNLC